MSAAFSCAPIAGVAAASASSPFAETATRVSALAGASQGALHVADGGLGCARAASSATPAAQRTLTSTLLAGAVGSAVSSRRRRRRGQVAAKAGEAGRSYVNVTGFPFPLGPIFDRRTLRKQVGDGIWTFEQEQSLANIAVNVRMTAIKLSCGGLWIHNPVAPTEECIELVKELGMPVKFIVLGTCQYEHKVFVGPFSRRWPEAKVYVAPQQWSWPIDLPTALFGIFSAGELKDRDEDAPWAAEIDQRVFNPPTRLGFSYSASECAFFHRRSKTLICTDALVYVPEQPPDVLDRGELQYLGLDQNIVLDLLRVTNWRGSGGLVEEAQTNEAASGSPRSDEERVRLGWQRDALLALYFGPDGRSIVNPDEAFRAISGRWIVGPVCYSLVYGGQIKRDVLDWISSVCEWDFQQIVPSHFAGPVAGTRDDVRRAFEVLEDGVDATKSADGALPWPFPQPVRYRPQDMQLLTDIQGVLRQLRVI